MRLFAVWRCSVLQIRRFYGGFQFIQPKKRSHGNNWELIPDFSFNCRTTLTWTWPDWKMKRFVKMSAEPSRWVMLWNKKGISFEYQLVWARTLVNCPLNKSSPVSSVFVGVSRNRDRIYQLSLICCLLYTFWRTAAETRMMINMEANIKRRSGIKRQFPH